MMLGVKTNASFFNRLRIDRKYRYEFIFISVVLLYELFSVFDILFFGNTAIQWEVIHKAKDIFADFTNVIGYSAEGDPYNHTLVYWLDEKGYPPLLYVISYLFSNSVYDMQIYYDVQNYQSMYIENKVLMIFVVVSVATIVFLYESIRTYKNGSTLLRVMTAAALSLSFPVLLSLERGNSIIASLVFMMLFLCFFESDNKVLREAAYISLAIAAAIKLTPAILGVILIIQKRWKDALRTIVYGFVFFFLPFLFLKGGMNNLPLFMRNLAFQLMKYKDTEGCTLLGCLLHYDVDYSDQLRSICSIVTIVICLLLLVSAFFIKRSSNRILLLCLIMIILPSHSANYTIIYMIPALIALLNETDKKPIDKIILAGGILCVCELGGKVGYYAVNHFNGLIVILICSVIIAVKTLLSVRWRDIILRLPCSGTR